MRTDCSAHWKALELTTEALSVFSSGCALCVVRPRFHAFMAVAWSVLAALN
jgi:hypothetical protein